MIYSWLPVLIDNQLFQLVKRDFLNTLTSSSFSTWHENAAQQPSTQRIWWYPPSRKAIPFLKSEKPIFLFLFLFLFSLRFLCISLYFVVINTCNDQNNCYIDSKGAMCYFSRFFFFVVVWIWFCFPTHVSGHIPIHYAQSDFWYSILTSPTFRLSVDLECALRSPCFKIPVAFGRG